MSEKRTVIRPTAPFGCLACGAGEGELHRVGCSHLQELNEAVRTLSGAGAVSPGPGPGTPPAPTGEPGDPAQGPGGGAGAPGPDGVDSTAQADWRDSQPRLMSLGGPGPWDPQAVARLQESLKSQRRQPIIAVGPAPSGTFDIGPSANTKAIDELKGRVATLEAQAEAVGVGLSRCESSVAGMTTTHADRIETIEDEVRALKRAVLELRGLSFDAHRAASDQKLCILINGEPAPAPLSSFRIPEAADHVRCPRCGSDDPDRYVICTGGDTTEPHFHASCHYLKDSDLWHESARATRGIGAKRPTHARLVRAVERWVGGYAIPAGTVLEIIGWSSDYPRIANRAAPASHPAPWFILHPGEWEACECPEPYAPQVNDVVSADDADGHMYGVVTSVDDHSQGLPIKVKGVGSYTGWVGAYTAAQVQFHRAATPEELKALEAVAQPCTPVSYVPKVGDVVIIVKTAPHCYHEWWHGAVGTVEKQLPWIHLSTHRIRLAYAPNYGGGDPRAKFDAHGIETISLLPEYVRLATPEECAAAGLVMVSARTEEPVEPAKEQAPGRPVVVCLCGSTRFHQNFIQANERLTLEGKIVLSVGSFGYAKGVPLTEEQKVKLDELHKRKIDMADEVLVLNVGGYIGSSTRGEIQYAWDHGKRVTFLEPADIGEVRSAVAWGEKRPDAAPAAPTQCPSCHSPDREHRLLFGNINDRYPCRDTWHGAAPKAIPVPPKAGSRVVRLLTDVRTPGGVMPKGTVAWVAEWEAFTGKAVIISAQDNRVVLNDEEWEAAP